MANKTTGAKNSNFQNLTQEEEFLFALLDSDETIQYPWNPSECEDYFSLLDEASPIQDLLTDEELTHRSQQFYNHLDNLWDNKPFLSKVEASLNLHFKAIPEEWLSTIAKKAVDIFTTQKSKTDQLIECVQAVLPTWSDGDLMVMARPFAYNMRNDTSQNSENLFGKVENLEWEKLTNIEKARVSLAIAHFAIEELKKNPE